MVLRTPDNTRSFLYIMIYIDMQYTDYNHKYKIISYGLFYHINPLVYVLTTCLSFFIVSTVGSKSKDFSGKIILVKEALVIHTCMVKHTDMNMHIHIHNIHTYMKLTFIDIQCCWLPISDHQQTQCWFCVFLLLIPMLWHKQAIFKSKGDKLSSSAECRTYTHTQS